MSGNGNASKSSKSKNASKPNDLKTYLSGPGGAPISPEEAAQKANPNYMTSRDYQRNCQRCVWAYELQRRGYEVEALPTYKGDKLPYNGNWRQLGMLPLDNKNGFYIQGKTYKSEITNIKGQMSSWGEGSRGIVRVVWKGRNSGHVFNVEQKGGKLLAYDAQTGKKVDLTDYMSRTSRGFTALYRTDNAKIDLNTVSEYVKMR